MKYTERTKAEQIANAYFDMGAGWAESGGLLRDLREMEQGYLKQLADAQARVEALQGERDEAIRIACGRSAALDAEREKVKVMTESKVRCWNQWTFAEQEVKEHAETIEGLQSELSQLQALVRIYKEAVDYYAKTAISARAVDALEKAATLDATTPAKEQHGTAQTNL